MAYTEKIQAYTLANEWPVLKLKKQLEENRKTLTFEGLPGIPRTIFHVAKEIEILELIQCGFDTIEFHICELEPVECKGSAENFANLKKLSIIQCNLEEIPHNILNFKPLKELSLKGNSIHSITRKITRWRT